MNQHAAVSKVWHGGRNARKGREEWQQGRDETGGDGGNASFRPSMAGEAQSRAAGPVGETAEVVASRKASSAGLVPVGCCWPVGEKTTPRQKGGWMRRQEVAGTAVWERRRDTGDEAARIGTTYLIVATTILIQPRCSCRGAKMVSGRPVGSVETGLLIA